MIILYKIKIQLYRFKHLNTWFLILTTFSLKAQFYNLPNEYFFNTFSQRQLARLDSEQIHSSIQPYIPFFNKKYEFVGDTHRLFKYISDDPFLDKVFKKMLAIKS